MPNFVPFRRSFSLSLLNILSQTLQTFLPNPSALRFLFYYIPFPFPFPILISFLRSVSDHRDHSDREREREILIRSKEKKEKGSAMAEEHRFQSPEGHRLCANNCGFFGSPATMNLCSKCYRDQQNAAIIKSTVEASLSSPSPSSPVSLLSPPEIAPRSFSPASGEARSAQDGVVSASGSASASKRCSVCRKRVGLTGFKCRCGTTFCGSHRYPEKHECSFDFKSVGREEIARANPVVKAEKLDRI